MRVRRLSLAGLLLILVALAIGASRALSTDPPRGGRPRNVAVSDDGNTILVTSMASNDVTIFTHDGSGPSPDPYILGIPAKSWGVCFVDADHAVVTHPEVGALSVLTRSGSSQSFIRTGAITVPVGCTEVIRSSAAGHAFVANKGAPVAGAEKWQHSVIEVDVNTMAVVGTAFITEREPRALALSPDGSRLFVGTAQGALGGSTVVGTNTLFGAPAPFDGGSVVAYNVSTREPLQRFPAGSPVRGLAVWPPTGGGSSPNGHYRIFFTHLGDGAQSEAPIPVQVLGTSTVMSAGGRAIANVISSVAFDQSNAPLSRQNVIIDHSPDHSEDAPTTAAARVSGSLPAVVPEKLVVRAHGQGGQFTYNLWVTNSASGTVSRADLDVAADGAIVTSGTYDLLSHGFDFPVVTQRNADNTLNVDAASTANATTSFGLVASPTLIYVNEELNPAEPLDAFTSVPMGICWSPANDSLFVANEGDQHLVRMSPVDLGTSFTRLIPTTAQNPAELDERRFFTFGRGFDFREGGSGPAVQNLACISCHPDGHLDGKVRFTLMAGFGASGNHLPAGQTSERMRPVAVPSVFDVGNTEWIFFEGLRTIRDGNDSGTPDEGHLNPGCTFIYCTNTGFFPNTARFTTAVASPPSPFAPTGSLSTNQLWGRYFFQKMNCTRCHQGSLPASQVPFTRANGESSEEAHAQTSGPLPADLANENQFLHDLGQSFITSQDGPPSGIHNELGDNTSFRNMVDVGTRTETGGVLLLTGVNTPALAGAWDNAPYFHDGRYRTLEQVLDHTWVDTTSHLSAPIFTLSSAVHDPPDNAFNDPSQFLISNATPILGPQGNTPLFTFGTHQATAPTGTQSVSSFLNSPSNGLEMPPGGSRVDALLDFLRAVSSKTNLTPDLTVTDFSWIVSCTPAQTTVSWQTPYPVSCQVQWGPWTSSMPYSFTTPEGTTHSQVLATSPSIKKYKLRITIKSANAPLANMSIPRLDYPQPVMSWSTTNCVEGAAAVGPSDFAPAQNPSKFPVRLGFSVPAAGLVAFEVFDLAGRRVRQFEPIQAAAGDHSLTWDGTTDAGSRVSTGTYFVVMKAPDGVRKRRIVLVR